MSPTTIRAWLYVRGAESIRIVLDGTSLAVYGPGSRFNHTNFGEFMDATLHQASIEQSLVLDGWTLEQLTTERRVNPAAPRAVERRGNLRLVQKPEV